MISAGPTFASPQPATVVVAFDRGHIVPLLAKGEADRVTHRPVNATDPVRVASISKLVTALGVMRMVDAHRLDLDRDVSDYLGWRLRNPAFPDVPITLRLLLSHRSSLLDGDDLYLIPLGTSLQSRLTDPRVWDAGHSPGSDWFHYTNLNFPVVASVMEAASGERFDRLMTRLVLRPLRLDACFNWSGCSPALAARAVVLYRSNGEVAKDALGGQLPVCPVLTTTGTSCDLGSYQPGANGALFSPQGGLRISMLGLARVGQVLARRGRGFLSPGTFAQMTAAQWRFNGRNGVGENGFADGFFCEYGLALQTIGAGSNDACHDLLFDDHRLRIGHAGDAYGLKSGLWLDPKTGSGVAYFATAVAENDPGARSAFSASEELLANTLIERRHAQRSPKR